MSPARAAIFFLRNASALDSRRQPKRVRQTFNLLFVVALLVLFTSPFPGIMVLSAASGFGYLAVFCPLTAAVGLATSSRVRTDTKFRLWLFVDTYVFLALGGIGCMLLWLVESAVFNGLVPTGIAFAVAMGLWVTAVALSWIGLFAQRWIDGRKAASDRG
jgi:hypothetical protein